MVDKNTKLSITLTARDDASRTVSAFMARVKAALAPMREALAPLRAAGGKLVGLFKTIGSAIGDALGKIPLIGSVLAGTIGGAVIALKSFIDSFDELGDKSEAIGVTADFLAQMRFAAKKSGAEVEELDSGLQNFTKSLGQARANTGRMTAFLSRVSPALLKQLKAAKSNEEAFDLLAQATAKLEDPAKRAALAQATLGSAALAPLLARGGAGVKALRDRYVELAGGQQDAVDAAGEFDDAMIEMDASVQGIKAALVTGLAPALTIVVGKLRDWFAGHREDIKVWAVEFGEKLPGAISKVVDVLSGALDKVKSFFAEMSKVIDAADMFLNGPKELEGLTLDEVKQGPAGLASRRLKNELKGTEGMSRGQLVRRQAQLFGDAAALTSGEHSQRDEDRAEAKRAAAQIIRERIGFGVTDLKERSFGAGDLRALAEMAARGSHNKLTVRFENAPKALRVNADPSNPDAVDTDILYTGNQMLSTP